MGVETLTLLILLFFAVYGLAMALYVSLLHRRINYLDRQIEKIRWKQDD